MGKFESPNKLRGSIYMKGPLQYPRRIKMNFEETLSLLETLIPAVIGGTIGLLALVGLREFFRETKIAFKKSVRA